MLQCNISITKNLITLFVYNICFLYMLMPNPPSLHHHLWYLLTISVENRLVLFCHVWSLQSSVQHNTFGIHGHVCSLQDRLHLDARNWRMASGAVATSDQPITSCSWSSALSINHLLPAGEGTSWLPCNNSFQILACNLLIDNVGTMLWYMEEAELIQLFFNKIASTALDLH